jgi:hypothetical protein
VSNVIDLETRRRNRDHTKPETTTYRVESRILNMIFGNEPTTGGVA